MKTEQMLEILQIAGRLKTRTRHNWTEGDRKESVADHCYRMSLMAMLLTGIPEFKDVDIDRVIRMCLIHDLGEAFTGDIPSFEKTENDSEKEDRIFAEWVESFPQPQRSEWEDLLGEMNALKTKEAKIYKALDKLEAVISHNEADISTWLPLERELQLTYAEESTEFSLFLEKLRNSVDTWTRQKMDEEQKEM